VPTVREGKLSRSTEPIKRFFPPNGHTAAIHAKDIGTSDKRHKASAICSTKQKRSRSEARDGHGMAVTKNMPRLHTAMKQASKPQHCLGNSVNHTGHLLSKDCGNVLYKSTVFSDAFSLSAC
jgi:hypothetical protein